MRVERAAFPSDDEARLVTLLWEADNVILSLVAEDDGEVIGHILFSPLTVEDGQTVHPGVCLGPVAVVPDRQREGIGAMLIGAGLQSLREMGHTAVFLLGHPDYYPRFGFRPAREFDVHYGDDRDAFMAIELVPGALAHVSGNLRFAPQFAEFE